MNQHCPDSLYVCLSGADVLECSGLSRTVQEYCFLVCLEQRFWSVQDCPGVLLPCLSGADVLECPGLSRSTASLSVWGRRSGVSMTVQEYCFLVCLEQTFWSVQDCPGVLLPCLSGADVLECSGLSRSTASLSVWGRRSGVFRTVQEYCFLVCLREMFWSVQDCPGVLLPCLSGGDVLECPGLSRSTASLSVCLSVWGRRSGVSSFLVCLSVWGRRSGVSSFLVCLSGGDVLECPGLCRTVQDWPRVQLPCLSVCLSVCLAVGDVLESISVSSIDYQ